MPPSFYDCSTRGKDGTAYDVVLRIGTAVAEGVLVGVRVLEGVRVREGVWVEEGVVVVCGWESTRGCAPCPAATAGNVAQMKLIITMSCAYTRRWVMRNTHT